MSLKFLKLIQHFLINVKCMYIEYISIFYGAPLVALVVKNLPAKGGDIRVTASTPGSGRSPGGGHGNPLQYSQPTPVFSPGESHGQKSLENYSP